MQPKTPQRRTNFRKANRSMPRRRIDIALEALDYKNPDILKKFVTEHGKILPRRMTGTCARHQRRLTLALKRARHIALLPFAAEVR